MAEFLKAELLLFGKESLNYDVLVYRAPISVVFRKLSKIVKNKFDDPAVVVLDPTLSYAIPVLCCHEGANEVALKLEKIGIKAIITTSAEFEESYSIGVGFRKDTKCLEIVDAVLMALIESKICITEVKILSTAIIKKSSLAFREASKFLGIPIGFVSSDAINSMDVKTSSASKIGLKSVAEACALFYSKNFEIVFPKKVYGGVTVAIAR
ncbi:MAG: cobalamin biosynthesis protein [Archaeoglobaceae archaeon]|nr:cobalamin biosynthesis protein [Archaeoglobaceae archaeon]MCX8152499.1 cobalamin biosynthesis protein [Archaeoglobaceae archaeon]